MGEVWDPFVEHAPCERIPTCEAPRVLAVDDERICCLPGQKSDRREYPACTGHPAVVVSVERRAPIASPTLGKLVWVPAGEFYLAADGQGGERLVKVSKGFYMMERELNRGQYLALTGNRTTRVSGSRTVGIAQVRRPVYGVVRNDDERGRDLPALAISLAEALELAERASELDGRSYRIPTVDEFHWASTGGARDHVEVRRSSSVGAEWVTFKEFEFDEASYFAGTARGCSRGANGFGLCDLTGNQDEWVHHPPSRRYGTFQSDVRDSVVGVRVDLFDGSSVLTEGIGVRLVFSP